mgnify:FL=1
MYSYIYIYIYARVCVHSFELISSKSWEVSLEILDNQSKMCQHNTKKKKRKSIIYTDNNT